MTNSPIQITPTTKRCELRRLETNLAKPAGTGIRMRLCSYFEEESHHAIHEIILMPAKHSHWPLPKLSWKKVVAHTHTACSSTALWWLSRSGWGRGTDSDPALISKQVRHLVAFPVCQVIELTLIWIEIWRLDCKRAAKQCCSSSCWSCCCCCCFRRVPVKCCWQRGVKNNMLSIFSLPMVTQWIGALAAHSRRSTHVSAS